MTLYASINAYSPPHLANRASSRHGKPMQTIRYGAAAATTSTTAKENEKGRPLGCVGDLINSVKNVLSGAWKHIQSFFSGFIRIFTGEPEASPEPAPVKPDEAAPKPEPQQKTVSLPAPPANVTKPVQLHKPMSEDELFKFIYGDDLKKLSFKQGTMDNCYFLSALDAILHHPMGKQLLSTIKIEMKYKNRSKKVEEYTVTFPSGLKSQINVRELGAEWRKKVPVQGPLAIQLLELAYAKAVPEIKGDLSERAFMDMFGGKPIQQKARFNVPTGKIVQKTDPFKANPNALKDLEQFLSDLSQPEVYNKSIICAYTPEKLPDIGDRRHDFIYLINPDKSWKAFYREHTYSIRGFDLAKREITLANPHDTAKEVFTLSFEDFIKVFRGISGFTMPDGLLK